MNINHDTARAKLFSYRSREVSDQGVCPPPLLLSPLPPGGGFVWPPPLLLPLPGLLGLPELPESPEPELPPPDVSPSSSVEDPELLQLLVFLECFVLSNLSSSIVTILRAVLSQTVIFFLVSAQSLAFLECLPASNSSSKIDSIFLVLRLQTSIFGLV